MTDLKVKLIEVIAVLLAGSWFWPWLLLVPPVAVSGIQVIDWLPVRGKPAIAVWALAGLTALAGLVAVSLYAPLISLIVCAILLGIVILNRRYYAFFARERHPFFAVLVVPMHVLYYLYSAAAKSATDNWPTT